MCDVLTTHHHEGIEQDYQMKDGAQMTLCVYHSTVPSVLTRNGKPVLARDFDKQDRVSALRELLNL